MEDFIMRNYMSICEEISINYRKMHELNEQKYTANYSEKNALYKQVEQLETVNKVLCNNARCVLFQEVFPDVLKIMHKYAGKAMGEKTTEKFKSEVKETLNCGIWIDAREFHIYRLNADGCSMHGDENSIDISTNRYDDTMLQNNKLQVYDIEKYVICNTREYIENVEEYLQKITELKAKAREMQEKLRDICSEYNSLTVDKMEYIDYTHHIY